LRNPQWYSLCTEEEPAGRRILVTESLPSHLLLLSGVAAVIAAPKGDGTRKLSVDTLAFLAPELVKAAVERRLPRGIGVTRLRDAPAEWSRQYAMLGLPISF
jgi:hypothetical protein